MVLPEGVPPPQGVPPQTQPQPQPQPLGANAIDTSGKGDDGDDGDDDSNDGDDDSDDGESDTESTSDDEDTGEQDPEPGRDIYQATRSEVVRESTDEKSKKLGTVKSGAATECAETSRTSAN